MELKLDNRVRPFQVFARLLTGDTKALLFDAPLVCALAVKERIFELTKLPISEQRLICAGRQLDDVSLIPAPDSTVHLCLRLRGGKGGFGSLLRGAATKAGQKKTNNFDACRDMSGRRLRHVNAEKKLEEWRAEEEDRKLEKIAEDFIKKNAKKGKKGVGDVEANKYVQKYREDSAKCVAQVELSVREAVGSSATFRRSIKRKAGEDAGLDGKKLKIWMGKRKLAESDSDNTDGDISEDDDEHEKSVILDNSNSSDSAINGKGSSDSSSGKRQESVSAGSTDNGSEEEKDSLIQELSEPAAYSSPKEFLSNHPSGIVEPKSDVGKEDQGSTFLSSAEAAFLEGGVDHAKKEEVDKLKHRNDEVTASQTAGDLLNSDDGSAGAIQVADDTNVVLENKIAAMDKTVSLEADKGEVKPLNFEEYNSAAKLEVLGLGRLKTELQMRGLKCGGTLQERASRLYLLKSTPLDKIPKKLLAKKLCASFTM